jgi:hypothetical protein
MFRKDRPRFVKVNGKKVEVIPVTDPHVHETPTDFQPSLGPPPERFSKGLGLGAGAISLSDGWIEYRRGFEVFAAFKVRIQDIKGFSVRRATEDDQRKFVKGINPGHIQEVLTIQGDGIMLAEVGLTFSTAQKIISWIEELPDFKSSRTSSMTTPKLSVADELKKLAELHQSGALTEEEFQSLKNRLLA